MSKGCEQCKYLEWVDGECVYGSDSGFTCIKRQEQMHADNREHELLDNLMKDSYRNRYKRCFESK